MKCSKCNSEHNEYKDTTSGPHVAALYCKDCGKWLKWLPKAASSYKDNTTWEPPTPGYTRAIFGRRHTR